MIERYQLLQTICLYVTLSTGIILALSGFGWNYYSRKIVELKSVDQKKASETTTNQILASNEKIIDLIKNLKDMEQDSSNKKKINISAPNALIVTSEQSGGTNIVNYNPNIPLPKIILSEWTIKNEKEEKVPMTPNPHIHKYIDIKSKYDLKYVFFNQIIISYTSEVSRNQIGLRINKDDIIIGNLVKSGSLRYKNGYTPDQKFVFVIQQPENGLYKVNLYSKSEIKNPGEIIDYLK